MLDSGKNGERKTITFALANEPVKKNIAKDTNSENKFQNFLHISVFLH
jgi:hypothetical protein